MEKLSICRICMIQDARMYYVDDRELQETFEKLVDAQFECEGARPLRVCYVCKAHLLSCHRLRLTAVRSEQRFQDMLDNNQFDMPAPQEVRRLQLVLPPLVRISIPPTGTHRDSVTDDTKDDIFLGSSIIIPDMDESLEDIPSNIKLEPTNVKEESDVETKPDPGLPETIEPSGSFQSNALQGMCKLDEAIWKCDICDQLFSRRTKLLKHLRCHNISAKAKYKCSICEKPCTDRNQLLYHVQSHTVKLGKIEIKEEKKYKCDICFKLFNLKGSLYAHMRTHTGVKPHKCTFCEKAFNIKSVLIHHMRLHTGERPFKCKWCGVCFKQKVTLDKHIRTHTGDKPYECNVCGKLFTDKSNVTRHMLIHTGEKPFKCDICQKSFNQKITLSKHYVRHQ